MHAVLVGQHGESFLTNGAAEGKSRAAPAQCRVFEQPHIIIQLQGKICITVGLPGGHQRNGERLRPGIHHTGCDVHCHIDRARERKAFHLHLRVGAAACLFCRSGTDAVYTE